MGGTYWPALGGHATRDLGYGHYSTCSLSGSGTGFNLALRNASGTDRVRYAWADN
jgi:endoglucanase